LVCVLRKDGLILSNEENWQGHKALRHLRDFNFPFFNDTISMHFGVN